jgi:triacylglycerol lipase
MDGIGPVRATHAGELAGVLADEPAPRGDGDPKGPIVLIHGFGGWSRGLLPLERHLRASTGRDVVRLQLGAGLDGIDHLAQRAAAKIDRVAGEARRGQVDVVGHSMGGLVAAFVAKHLDARERIRRVVTLGTPHRGTALALSGMRYLGRIAGALEHMVPGCAFLAALDRAPLPDGAALVSVAGLGDLVVPAPCTRLPRRARHHNRSLSAADHWGLIYASEAQALVARLLRGTPLAPPRQKRAPARAGRIEDGRDRLQVVE